MPGNQATPLIIKPDRVDIRRVISLLICKNPVGETPHSAILLIEAGSIDNSALGNVDFGDGKREKLDTVTRLHNHYYEVAGRDFAVL
ncbi:hypothetical protein [Fibrella forsythiae]|uniref:Uncharacterized protein n=1 Tax=Fibrella forsythiae TaxID=2817061 RepID=A0ABS3JLS5_9BACT|nr:hypothetical protein [Fibrella forsythiae]MBO0950955.1 hypothetical protein [Fibrella forsythiae]